MTTRKAEETFYDVLKVDPRATITEIVAAYHSAKNAFSKDSVATYSLFSPEETNAILSRLEEAYLTLSNVDKKREYDRQMLLRQEGHADGNVLMADFQNSGATSAASEAPVFTPTADASSRTETSSAANAEGAEVRRMPTKIPANAPAIEIGEGPLTGAMLREAREKRALSLDDVSRITKIPTKFLRAIETDELRTIPARVYLQGFVKNLATLYRLDPAQAVKAYLQHIDSLPNTALAG